MADIGEGEEAGRVRSTLRTVFRCGSERSAEYCEPTDSSVGSVHVSSEDLEAIAPNANDNGIGHRSAMIVNTITSYLVSIAIVAGVLSPCAVRVGHIGMAEGEKLEEKRRKKIESLSVYYMALDTGESCFAPGYEDLKSHIFYQWSGIVLKKAEVPNQGLGGFRFATSKKSAYKRIEMVTPPLTALPNKDGATLGHYDSTGGVFLEWRNSQVDKAKLDRMIKCGQVKMVEEGGWRYDVIAIDQPPPPAA